MQISSNTPTNGRADNYTSVISGTPAKTHKKLLKFKFSMEAECGAHVIPQSSS